MLVAYWRPVLKFWSPTLNLWSHWRPVSRNFGPWGHRAVGKCALGNSRKYPYLTMGWPFGVLRARGFFKLDFLRHGGTLHRDSKGMGAGFRSGISTLLSMTNTPPVL